MKFPKYFLIAILLLIFLSIFIRGEGISYSNFQGDEENTINFVYKMNNGVWDYFMEQRRGPMQYLINITNVGIFGYHNEWQIRLPYLIFGVAAFYSFFILTRRIYSREAAIVTTTLLAINGLFLAFSRITQYQAFMYFLVPIGIYIFIKALEDRSDYKKLIISGLIMMIALLGHYDTLSVIPFFVVGFLAYYFRLFKMPKGFDNEFDFIVFLKSFRTNLPLIREMTLRAFVFFTAFLLPAIAFYLPFYMGSAFESTTSGYLQNRLLGGGFMPRTEITLKLLTMYVPKFHLYFIFVLGVIGIAYGFRQITGFKIGQIKTSKKLVRAKYLVLSLLILAASVFSLYPIKPRTSSILVILASVAIAIFLTMYRKVQWERAALITWFLGAYSFYFFVMNDPRTHVYVAMMPLLMIAGYAFVKIYESTQLRIIAHSFLVLSLASFIFVTALNWHIFVDKDPEYPWWDKDFYGYEMYRIERVRHKKIEGVFGFNNYRGWEQVADFYNRGCLVGSFNSNEKDPISYFYVRQHQKQGDVGGMQTDSDNLVILEGPHSWEYYNLERLPNNFILLHTIYSNDYPVTRIYGQRSLYPEGEMLCQE